MAVRRKTAARKAAARKTTSTKAAVKKAAVKKAAAKKAVAKKAAAKKAAAKKAVAKKAVAKKAAARKAPAGRAATARTAKAKVAKAGSARKATAKKATAKKAAARKAPAKKASARKAPAKKATAKKATAKKAAVKKSSTKKAGAAKAKSSAAKAAKRSPARRRRRDALNPAMPTGSVSFMHPEDVGRLHVPGSKRQGKPIVPNYSRNESGVDTVKVIMATDHFIVFESFRPKGAVDPLHQHPDHYSIVYQKAGRVRMRIGDETVIVEAGDSYFHPIGVVHHHEALEDSIRIETKVYPKGGAVAAWRRLVGDPAP